MEPLKNLYGGHMEKEYMFGEDEADLVQDYYDNQEDYLGCWASEGTMAICDWSPLPQTVEFVVSQFDRFGIPFPPELSPLIDSAYSTLLYYLNHYNPYCVFSGLTEVQVTDHWQNFSYCITASNGMKRELPVNKIETYKLYPGDDHVIFNDLMSKPGLDAVDAFDMDDEDLFGEGSYFDFWHRLDSWNCHEVLADLCTKMVDGKPVFFEERKEGYAKLAIWACLMHIISPEMRDFRRSVFPIIDCCYEGGECIIYENEIFDGTLYTKQERVPISCSECGIIAWCVELAQLGNISRYICEHCLNGTDGIQKRPYACGLKMCPVIRCPNHPQHNTGGSGIGYYRTHGQLNAMASENTGPMLGAKDPRLIGRP